MGALGTGRGETLGTRLSQVVNRVEELSDIPFGSKNSKDITTKIIHLTY